MSKYIKLFSTHTEYEAAQSSLILPNVSFCVDTPNEVHYNPYVEPVDPCASEIVQTTYEWVEIGGLKWATKNVGALTVTDYGQKFSWGGISGYTNDQVSGSCHAFSWTDYEYGNGGSSAGSMTKYNSDGKMVLDAVDDAATVNMGSGWRMPTSGEFKALRNATTNTWVTNYNGSGINGRLFTSTSDSSKTLFFPAAGYCNNGSVIAASSVGYYWSSSLYYSDKTYAYYIYFSNGSVNWEMNSNRCYGRSVRGIYVG